MRILMACVLFLLLLPRLTRMQIVARIASAINLSKDIADVSYGYGHQRAPHKPPASFNILSIDYPVSIMIDLDERIICRSRRTSRGASSTATIVVAFFSQGVCSAPKV